MPTNNFNRFDAPCNIGNFNIVKTKTRLFKMYYKQLLRVLMPLIKIKNLPESMPEADILFLLYTNGHFTMGKGDDGKVYGFNGALGGEPSPYYLPTISTVANAGLNFSKTFEIGKDCIVVKCDSMYQGFNDLISLTAALLTSIDISFYWNIINTRTANIYESGNDTIKKSIEEVFQSLEDGDKLKVIASKPLFDFIKTKEYAKNDLASNIKALIEVKQYIKALFFMVIGLPSNYNMKRESLNENELDADIYTIAPQMDDVFKQLKEDFDKANKMFGYNIQVERDSSLEQVHEDIEARGEEQQLDIDAAKKQIDSNNDKSNDDDVSDDKGGKADENI